MGAVNQGPHTVCPDGPVSSGAYSSRLSKGSSVSHLSRPCMPNCATEVPTSGQSETSFQDSNPTWCESKGSSTLHKGRLEESLV